MMNFDDELYQRYLDGELSPEENRLLQQKMKEDESVRLEVERWRDLHTMLQQLEPEHAPAITNEAVLQRMRKEELRKKFDRGLFIGTISFFSFLLVGVLSYAFYITTDFSLSSPKVDEVQETVGQYTQTGQEFLRGVFSSDIVSTISMIIVFLIVVFSYLALDKFRTVKHSH